MRCRYCRYASKVSIVKGSSHPASRPSIIHGISGTLTKNATRVPRTSPNDYQEQMVSRDEVCLHAKRACADDQNNQPFFPMSFTPWAHRIVISIFPLDLVWIFFCSCLSSFDIIRRVINIINSISIRGTLPRKRAALSAFGSRYSSASGRGIDRREFGVVVVCSV